MSQNSSYNILMYSHDSYGLGHIRRSMAIAESLRQPDVNTLIVTGSPIVGRFDIPERVDFVRVPGMIKCSNDLYLPHSIKIDPVQALNIRQAIITATAQAFEPDLFIVDKAPLGMRKEILPTLEWLNRPGTRTRTVLGLRDIMDDAESTRREWSEKGIYDILDRYYSEIWVYGDKRYYDPVAEYAIPARVSSKVVFTGYIPRQLPHAAGGAKGRPNGYRELLTEGLREAWWKKLVLVTTGGGGDGYPVLDAYLSMLEAMKDPPFHSVVVAGPFLAKAERRELAGRAAALGVRFHDFYRRMEDLLAAADLVVCMGGYNTFCEVMSHRKLSLVIPRETPRQEQRIRAEVMNSHGLVDWLPWPELTPARLGDKVLYLLDHLDDYQDSLRAFTLSGLEVMRARLELFRRAAAA